MAINNYLTIPAKILKTDISSTDVSFKLQDIKWYTGSDGIDVSLTAGDFGSSNKAWGVWEPRTDREEWFEWDTSTIANFATSGITINSRGLIRTSPYTTQAAARKFTHSGGTKVLLFTNAPAFYNEFSNKGNAETITGLHTFPNDASTPRLGSSYVAPTVNVQVASKGYVDAIAFAGAPDASTTVKGVVEEATGAEMAAGTATGGTGARLFIPSAQAKSTSAGAGDANKVPVTNGSGVLDQTFLDAVRTWATVQTFSANTAQITTDPDSANDAVRSSYLAAQFLAKDYGDGSDGAFSQAAGTTTLNTASKTIYQYTSFSLTGTAVLQTGSNLTNQPLYIFVQGDLTITSSASPAVNLVGRGAPGGAGVAAATPGNPGNPGLTYLFATANGSALPSGSGGNGAAGGGGGSGLGNNGGTGTRPSGGTTTTGSTGERYSASYIIGRLLQLAHIGGGGGSGAGSSAAGTGGAGGNGGGCIIFIVGGNINITSIFSVAGSTGTAGGANGGGGGGGGGGGHIGIFYAGSVTANTATLTVSGGGGGAPGAGNDGGGFAGGSGGAGGAGQSVVRKIASGLAL